MDRIDLKDVGDTEGGFLILRKTPFKEIGILATGRNAAVYWKAVDTDKVVKAINTLKEAL